MHDHCDHPDRPDHACLKRLLTERNQFPERAVEIDAGIHKAFGRQVAILVLDMCGFSGMTAKYGIIHFLAMIHQMEQAACPAVTGNGGHVIKQEADNIYAVFPESAQALEAALDIFRAFDAMNAVLPEGRDIHGSIGIGFGDTLVIDNKDMFGNEMNLACKLGEDLAGRNEILLTASAYSALPAERYEFSPCAFSISSVEIPCHKYQRSLFPEVDMNANTDKL